MVRFIICRIKRIILNKHIYIPLWLDLLSRDYSVVDIGTLIYIPLWLDLLLILKPLFAGNFLRFTFHYGQIYYKRYSSSKRKRKLFTFHYGQIYYPSSRSVVSRQPSIYIPLWLDLLYISYISLATNSLNLHSTMVRFIIWKKLYTTSKEIIFTFHYGQIYYKRSTII